MIYRTGSKTKRQFAFLQSGFGAICEPIQILRNRSIKSSVSTIMKLSAAEPLPKIMIQTRHAKEVILFEDFRERFRDRPDDIHTSFPLGKKDF